MFHLLKRFASIGLVCGGLSLSAGEAWAAPILWTLQDVTLANGGTLTGSFVFDIDSPPATEVEIHASTGWSFETGDISHSSEYLLLLETDGAPRHSAYLLFSGLTATGGWVDFDLRSVIGECYDATCSGIVNSSSVTGGRLVGTPVPEPASILFLGTGLTLAGLRRWRRRRA